MPVSHGVVNYFQVIWIACGLVRVQVNEDRLLFRLAVKEQLDELVQVGPLLLNDFFALSILALSDKAVSCHANLGLLVESAAKTLSLLLAETGLVELLGEAAGDGRQLSLSELWRELVGQLVEEELASSHLEVLLVDAVATFEACHGHDWRSLEQSDRWVDLFTSFLDLDPPVVRQGRQLAWLGHLVEEDPVGSSHALENWLTILVDLKLGQQLAFGGTLKDLSWRNSDMLLLIVFGSSLALVLGLDGSGAFVALLQVGVDLLRNLVNVRLDIGQVLNPAIQTSVTVFE